MILVSTYRYIAGEFARRIGKAEEEAFLTGNGVGKPSGVLASTGGAELGVTAANATSITYDEVIDLYYSLKTPYRSKAVFLTNDSTIKVLRKLKDGSGQYLWQPSLTPDRPDTILGRPIESCEYMPIFHLVPRSCCSVISAITGSQTGKCEPSKGLMNFVVQHTWHLHIALLMIQLSTIKQENSVLILQKQFTFLYHLTVKTHAECIILMTKCGQKDKQGTSTTRCCRFEAKI